MLIQWIPVAAGVLFVLLGIPLALDKVPPNSLYGFRTPKTQSGPGIWYPANRFAGGSLIVAGAAVAILTALMPTLTGHRFVLTMIADDVVVLSALSVVVVLGFARLRKL